MKHDLVLGCIQNYRWHQVSPFVNSLRDCGYSGEICFLQRNLDDTTINGLRTAGVTVKHITQKTSSRAIHPRSRYWRKCRFAPGWFRRWLFKRYCSFSSMRHFVYKDFLAEHGNSYRQIFIADVGDIVFQTNPLANSFPSGLHCFEEWSGCTLGSEPCNSYWLKNLFGEATLQEVSRHPVLCAGTILGDPASLRELFDHTTATLLTMRTILEAGDQACFNVTIRRHFDQQAHFHKNGDTVLTMGIMPQAEINLHESGQIIDHRKNIIPVLHQYNRHTTLYPKVPVLKKWLPQPS